MKTDMTHGLGCLRMSAAQLTTTAFACLFLLSLYATKEGTGRPTAVRPWHDAETVYRYREVIDTFGEGEQAYTLHTCVGTGDPKLPDSQKDRVCLFSQLCLTGSKFVYFQNPSRRLTWEVVEEGPVQKTPRANIVARMVTDPIQGYFPVEENTISVEIRTGPIPGNFARHGGGVFSDPLRANESDRPPPLVMLLHHSLAGNMGHLLADCVWPALKGLQRFTAFPRELAVLMTNTARTCDNPAPPDTPAACYRRRRAFIEVITPFPIRNRRDVAESVCFDRVLVGSGNDGLLPGRSPPHGLIKLWRDQVYHTLRIRHAHPRDLLEAPLLIVSRKDKQHAILNSAELVAALQVRYPKAVVKEADFRSMEPPNEVLLVSNATVLVTPCGGMSFASTYMQDGAAAIFTAACHPCGHKACCMHMESYMWYSMSHVHRLYYHFRGPASDLVNEASGEYADFSYRVNLDEMFALVDEAWVLTGFPELAAGPF
jgi:hypothetical protein